MFYSHSTFSHEYEFHNAFADVAEADMLKNRIQDFQREAQDYYLQIAHLTDVRDTLEIQLRQLGERRREIRAGTYRRREECAGCLARVAEQRQIQVYANQKLHEQQIALEAQLLHFYNLETCYSQQNSVTFAAFADELQAESRCESAEISLCDSECRTPFDERSQLSQSTSRYISFETVEHNEPQYCSESKFKLASAMNKRLKRQNAQLLRMERYLRAAVYAQRKERSLEKAAK